MEQKTHCTPSGEHASIVRFFVVHNNPSDCTSLSKADAQLSTGIADGAQTLRLAFVDHLIVGQANGTQRGFKRCGKPLCLEIQDKPKPLKR
jgi:hypothetical protein